MRSKRIVLPLVALVSVLVGAFLLTSRLERRVYDAFSAELRVQAGLSVVRMLQTDIRALQSERANIRSIEREWQESRLRFDRSLKEMDSGLAVLSTRFPQLSRMQNTWARMETLHTKVRTSLDALDRTGFLNRVGNSSLMVKYQESLAFESGSDVEVAELSLLLFYLEHADRMVQEIETELNSLDNDLDRLTQERISKVSVARWIVLAVTGLIVALLNVRIVRLYQELAQDNAARRAAEQAARSSEADLSATLNAIGDAVIATDETGRITRTNPAALAFLRRNQAAIVGHRLVDLVELRRANDGVVEDPIAEALQGAALGLRQGQYVLTMEGEGERRTSIMVSRIGSPEGRPGGAVLVIHEITEQFRMEEQLRRTQRIESLGRLAGGVAHDFNNLLQIIKGNLAFLQESSIAGPEEKEYLKQIDDASRKAADLTRQLLALGRRQTLLFREVDMVALLRGFLTLIRRVIGENIEVNLKCQDDLDRIQGDAGQLEQVLLNLCMNARDAIGPNGNILIELENKTLGLADLVAFPWVKEGRYVRMRVVDNGCGMGPDMIARLFEPFFTTKQDGRGSGLGLSVVQGIIHQHEGFVQVHSEPGKGTAFSIFLPSHPPGQSTEAEEGAEISRPLNTQGRDELVLFVEDEAPVRQVGMSILQRHGFRVIAAKDGVEACALARENKDQLSLAILDIVMPRMGGIDAAREIMGLLPQLPIILCTGYAGAITLPELNQKQGWHLITKPYSNRELASQARRAIDDAAMARLNAKPS